MEAAGEHGVLDELHPPDATAMHAGQEDQLGPSGRLLPL